MNTNKQLEAYRAALAAGAPQLPEVLAHFGIPADESGPAVFVNHDSDGMAVYINVHLS